MTKVGEREIRTQRRVVGFFRDALGYDYLGHWQDRPDNRNVEEGVLGDWFRGQGHGDEIITRAFHEWLVCSLIHKFGVAEEGDVDAFVEDIHTYKYDEAVADGVVLDLRYEARDIDQHIISEPKIDQWFEAKTKGLTDLATAQRG